jgi:hypothetical protein
MLKHVAYLLSRYFGVVGMRRPLVVQIVLPWLATLHPAYSHLFDMIQQLKMPRISVFAGESTASNCPQ